MKDKQRKNQNTKTTESAIDPRKQSRKSGTKGAKPVVLQHIILIIIVKPSGSESSPGCSCLLLRVGRGEWVAPLRQRPTWGRCPPSKGYVSPSPLKLEPSQGKFKKPLCCIINCKQSRGSSHSSACISFSVDTSKIPLKNASKQACSDWLSYLPSILAIHILFRKRRSTICATCCINTEPSKVSSISGAQAPLMPCTVICANCSTSACSASVVTPCSPCLGLRSPVILSRQSLGLFPRGGAPIPPPSFPC